jgi:hypothetical protein
MPQRYLSVPAFALPTVFLAEGELLALLLAHQYAGTALEPPLQAALCKIGRSLPEPVQIELQDVADTFTFAGGSGVGVPLNLVLDLVRAARERLVVRIHSYTASRDETGEREIEPHFLSFPRHPPLLPPPSSPSRPRVQRWHADNSHGDRWVGVQAGKSGVAVARKKRSMGLPVVYTKGDNGILLPGTRWEPRRVLCARRTGRSDVQVENVVDYRWEGIVDVIRGGRGLDL